MTDYSRLLEEGRIRRGRFSRKQADECLQTYDRVGTLSGKEAEEAIAAAGEFVEVIRVRLGKGEPG